MSWATDLFLFIAGQLAEGVLLVYGSVNSTVIGLVSPRGVSHRYIHLHLLTVSVAGRHSRF